MAPVLHLERYFHPSVALLVPVFVAAIIIPLMLWRKKPGMIMKSASNVGMYLFGLQRKTAKVDKITLAYVERGTRKVDSPTLFFIHGFSADKGMYMPVIMHLPRKQHVVLLDLPGHGDSEIPGLDQELHLEGIVNTVKQFVDAINLNRMPFHIIGTSLGGAISAVYAAAYPEDVVKATLVCPAMFTPVETEFQREVKTGKCLLLGNTGEEVGRILDKCMFQKKRIYKNKQVLQGLAQQRAPQKHFYDRVFRAITSIMNEENEKFVNHWIRSIKCPTQVIWGRQDELLHVSGAEVLKANLRNCVYADIIEDCGHVVSFDRPRSMVKRLKKFMKYPTFF